MLLGRSNKNDYGSQTQQIIWKGLGPTSAGLEPNFPHFPMDSLPGAFPAPAKTPRREMLRAAASPLGMGMTNARAGAAIAACSAPGAHVLPSDYTPHQITVWERVFPCGGKKKLKVPGRCGQFCSFQELRRGLRHRETRGQNLGRGDPPAETVSRASNTPTPHAWIKRLIKTGGKDSENEFKGGKKS